VGDIVTGVRKKHGTGSQPQDAEDDQDMNRQLSASKEDAPPNEKERAQQNDTAFSISPLPSSWPNWRAFAVHGK
jgi:hypothetical protein